VQRAFWLPGVAQRPTPHTEMSTKHTLDIGVEQGECAPVILLSSALPILANYMELSTTRQPTSCAATRWFPSILWNPKVHYRVRGNEPSSSHPFLPHAPPTSSSST
jgi:hypothetical protein